MNPDYSSLIPGSENIIVKILDILKNIDNILSSVMAVGTIPEAISNRARIWREKQKKKKRRKRKRALSNMNTHSPKADQNGMEPDPDAIKMFVGQVPRSMDENDLRKMLEEFGPVFQLNVLRDKVTGQSKGCCFITYYTRKAALDAQNALHNIKTLPGMQHPIQMKPADSEKRNIEERKLFIGMLSKRCNETDVRTMFAPFGQIEECTVLREQNGTSKGCAFITYASKQCAQNCIKAMHHSQTMEGCRYPVVVKFADTQKEKEMKKLQQVNSNILQNLGALGGLNTLTPQYLALIQQMAAAGGGGQQQQQQQQQQQNMGGLGNLGNLGLGLNALQMPQLLAAAASAAAALQNNPAFTATLATISSAMNNTNLAAAQIPATNGQNSCSNSSTPSSAGDVNSMQNLQQLQGLAALATLANSPGLGGSLPQQNLTLIQQLLANASQQGTGQQVPGLNNAGSTSPNSSTAGSLTSASSTTNPALLPGGYGQQNTLNSMGGGSGGATGGLGLGNSGGNALNGMSNTTGQNPGTSGGSTAQPSAMDTINQAYTGIQQYAGLSGLLNQASFPNAFTGQSQIQTTANSPAGKQTEGPDGANLFIYHLPQEFSDHDLLQMFMPFGSVISSKVFIDKLTNLSKCFGFVSYDNSVSAQAAIQAMNGFQIGMKRLKVQLKRAKSDSKPY